MEELRAIEPIAHHPRELSTGSVVHFFDNVNSTLSPTFSPDHPKGGEVYMYVRRPPSQERTSGCKGIDVHHKPNYTAWYKKATFAIAIIILCGLISCFTDGILFLINNIIKL